MDTHRQNPFPVLDAAGKVKGWKWYDETWNESERLYPSQRAALRDLLNYLDWLENGPTLWQRVWWPVRYTYWPKFLEMLRA